SSLAHTFYNCESLLLFLRKLAVPTDCFRASPTPATSANNPRARISRFQERGQPTDCCKLETQCERSLAQTRKIRRHAVRLSRHAKLASGHPSVRSPIANG